MPRFPIKARQLKLAKEDSKQRAITEISCVEIDIDGKHECIKGYIIEDLAYNIILGDPWMRHNNVIYNARPRYIRFGPPGGLIVSAKEWDKLQPRALSAKLECQNFKTGSARQVTGSDFESIATASCKNTDTGLKLFAATITDINKALEAKKKQTPKEIESNLPFPVRHNARFFNEDELNELPPHRPGLDTKIELVRDEKGKEKEIPCGPVYDMSREELKTMRKL